MLITQQSSFSVISDILVKNLYKTSQLDASTLLFDGQTYNATILSKYKSYGFGVFC